jgi:hypothetical protein
MTAVLSPQIKKQYFDINGDPLSGGKLNIYQAGTTTPVTTYQNSSETVTNTNPIILDTRGELLAIYLIPGSYKFVLTDPDDSVIWTKDNILIRDFGAEIDSINSNVTNLNTQITNASTSSRLVSGKKSANSSAPKFLEPIGTSNQVKVLATDTDLIFITGESQFNIVDDIVASGLVSPPTSNNTALVNDSTLSGQDYSKTLGEFGTFLNIDTIGSEISALNGQVAGFRLGASEYFVARIDTVNNVLKEAQRGIFVDSSSNSLERGGVSDNDTITLMKLTWLYIQSDASVLASYSEPFYGATQPSSPTDGGMWFDTVNQVWKRFNSTVFVEVEAVPLGLCLQDENGHTVAARAFEFYGDFLDDNSIELVYKDNAEVNSKSRNNLISVFGTRVILNEAALRFQIGSNLEPGKTEAVSTMYYFYIKENSDLIVSPDAPLDRRGDLKGMYHPQETWRNVGRIFNDASGNFDQDSLVTIDESLGYKKSFNPGVITSDYQLSVSDDVISLDSSGGAFDITLPDPSLAPFKSWVLIKINPEADAISLVGTINGLTNRQLFGEYETMEIYSNGSSYLIKSWDKPFQTVAYNTISGFGSTGTAIPYFANTTGGLTKGAGVFTVDNSSVNGLSVTVVRRAKFELSLSAGAAAGATIVGFSLNASSTTTAITGLTVNERLAIDYCRSGSTIENACASVSVILEPGDILRAHTNGVSGSNSQWILNILAQSI